MQKLPFVPFRVHFDKRFRAFFQRKSSQTICDSPPSIQSIDEKRRCNTWKKTSKGTFRTKKDNLKGKLKPFIQILGNHQYMVEICSGERQLHTTRCPPPPQRKKQMPSPMGCWKTNWWLCWGGAKAWQISSFDILQNDTGTQPLCGTSCGPEQLACIFLDPKKYWKEEKCINGRLVAVFDPSETNILQGRNISHLGKRKAICNAKNY